jgi:hypothetical protein
MERRECDSCRYFQPNDLSSLGICTHPEHQLAGVTPLVRAHELRCRRSFGVDDWSPFIGVTSSQGEDILISERPAPFHRPWRDMPLKPGESPDHDYPGERS